MEKVKLMIDLHLSNAKTIESVAKLLKSPPETLRKKFLRMEKVHLHDYILERKVKAMKEMLLISDLPCYTVCFNVGLREDTGAKLFKKISGNTMQEFREKYKLNYILLKNDPTRQRRLNRLLTKAFADHTENR